MPHDLHERNSRHPQARKLLSVPGVLLRRDTAKDAELLVLRHENEVLRRQIASPVRYELADRFWPPALFSLIPRHRCNAVFPVMPGTLLTWHRRLIAAKWDYSTRRLRIGRPATTAGLKNLVLRLARENARWGPQADPGRARASRAPDRRVHGRGDPACSPGIDPPHAAPAGCREFPTNQAEGIVAAGFFHLDTALGRRLYALALLEHGIRCLHITGVTAYPSREWVVQQAWNVATDPGVRIDSLRILLRDRDGKYGPAFDTVFQAEDIDALLGAPRAPRMNAPCERVIGTIGREALDHVPVMNEAHARFVLADFQQQDNTHRPHRSRGQMPPDVQDQPATVHDLGSRRLLRTRVLGGTLNEYRYAA